MASTRHTAGKTTGQNRTPGIKANGVENGQWNPTFAAMAAKALAACSAVMALGLAALHGQAPEQPELRSPAELIVVQDPPKVVPRVDQRATPDNTSIVVSLGRQRAYLLVDGEVAIDAPVSTGRRRGQTPVGEFTILEKSARHQSSLHGDFVDREGHVVRSGVSTRIDAAPSGTTFRPTEVRHFMRLTNEGLALHAGRVPGYAASDTTVRLPPDIAPLFFQRVQVGTPVRIED